MDDIIPAACTALQQRFKVLATQLRQIHAAWQEAVRAGNVPLQSALIARERALIADVQEVMAAYQDLIAPDCQ
jgi:hypothetical protein